MKKGRKYVIVSVCTIIMAISLVIISETVSYLHGIRKDWEKEFIARKSFLRAYEFSGIIVKRDFNGDYSQFPYSLTIELDTNTVYPSWIDSFYYYYDINYKKKTMWIVVSESIYKNVAINDSIIKKEDSDSIKIKHEVYLLLSKKRFEWLPL